MSGQKIIDGLQEVIDGHVGRITTVIVPEAKIFPVPEHMLTREQKRYLANRGYELKGRGDDVGPIVRARLERSHHRCRRIDRRPA